MKKLSGLIMMVALLVLPLTVMAANSINVVEGSTDGDGITSATVTANLDSETETITFTVTPQGGATIKDVVNASGSDWAIKSATQNNGVWTVTVSAPPVKGEHDLAVIKYEKSGEKDCKVVVSLGNTPSTPDKPEENKQTGSTIPYITLGLIALGATSAYLITRNKAKMYRI